MTTPEVRLKDLCDDAGQYGLNVPASEYASAGVRMLRTTDLSPNGRLRDDVDPVFVGNPPGARFLLEGGDLLLTRSGSVGRSFLVHALSDPTTFAGFLIRFRPRPSTDPRFLAYVAESTPFQDAVQADAISSTIQNFNAERYANIRVPNLPLDEQRRIADFLDAETARLDALLNERARQLELLSERRAALLVELLSGVSDGSRRPSGLDWLPSLPDGWPVVKLTLLARLGSGHTPSRSKPEWWAAPTIPWITTGEVAQLRDDRLETITVTREMISGLGLANSSAEVHPMGTVVLSRTASVGYSAVMGVDMATSQDFATWTCGPRIDAYYLLWTLRAMRPWLLGARAMGSTHKTIYMPDIQSLRVPLPPIEEQRSIVASVRSSLARIDQIHDALAAQQSLLAERRQALITAAVTGRLEVSAARSSGPSTCNPIQGAGPRAPGPAVNRPDR